MSGQDCEQLTLFPEDSHASHSALLGSEEARRMTVTSGQRCSELLKSSGPVGLLARMLLGSSLWHSTRCFLTWKISATPRNRLLFRLVPLTRHTDATGARSWPTPTVADAYTGDLKSSQQKPGSMHSVNLVNDVRMWPTPKATDYKGSGPRGSKSAEHDLCKGNLKGAVMYPTPTTGAGMCGGTGNYKQLKALEAAGEITPEECRSTVAGNGGQLNPEWVEWLMGFPIGWTELNV